MKKKVRKVKRGQGMRRQISAKNAHPFWIGTDFTDAVKVHMGKMLFDQFVVNLFRDRNEKEAKKTLEMLKDWI